MSKTRWWEMLEIERHLYFGVGWEKLIKINPHMICWSSYDYYHKCKYRTRKELAAGMLILERALGV